MKPRVAFVFCVVAVLAAALLLLTGTRGGRAYFSPYTLEYKTQAEFAVLAGQFPIYLSTLKHTENDLVAFIQEEGYVTAVPAKFQRWELIFHWNQAWKDGDGPLYDVLIRHRPEIIEWSKADPERARIYWSEGFKCLRSESEVDVETGREILQLCWRCQSTQELRAQITTIKRVRDEMYN